MRTHDWRKDLQAEQRQADEVKKRLTQLFPTAVSVEKASVIDDKAGTDFWLTFPAGRLGVDMKLRGVDPMEWGRDDLALEHWSVYESRRVGWTRDPDKRTDLTIWWWRPTDRIAILPYRILRDVFSDNWKDWAWKYGEQVQDNGNYSSRAVFVPAVVVTVEIEKHPGYVAEIERLAEIILY